MRILHVSCSTRGQASESSRLSQRIIGYLRERAPAATLVDRAIGNAAMPHIDANYALAQHAGGVEVSTAGSVSVSEELIRELESADVLVIATPMHNLTVPSTLKAWLDHVVRARRTFTMGREGKAGMLRDRPVFVAVASGGIFSGQYARQPDFLTPYLKLVLGTIGLHDLRLFSVEGTAAPEEAVAKARARTDQALQDHFSSAAL